MKRRVVVTGIGLVSPLATNVKDTWRKLINSESGLSNLSFHSEFLNYPDIPSKVAGKVNNFIFDIDSQVSKKHIPKWMQFGLAAANEAIKDSNWIPKTQHDFEKTGVCIGTGIGSIDEIYDANIKKLSPFFVPKILPNMLAGYISISKNYQGPVHCVSTACSTGANSIGDAMRFIQYNDADVMICGASESCISPLGITGFSRIKALSTNFNNEPRKASRPFDADRDGFVIGEGAGVLVLEEYTHAINRNAKIYAEICGYGIASDAHHYTSPSESGRGAIKSMSRALETANLSPSDIGYINAHATSTPLGDVIENRAINHVFKNVDVSVSSTKGSIGHLLGAAGSVEAIFSILALYHVFATNIGCFTADFESR